MRGLSCCPLRRSRRAWASSRPSLPKVFHQQIDHRPKMPALLDIDLEEVAHVVEAGRGRSEVALLLDRSGLRVALHHEQATKQRAIFARHFLPGRLTLVTSAGNRAPLRFRREQDAPAIVGHLDMAELGPAARIDADCGAQVHLGLLVALRPHVLPPIQIVRPPGFKRALELLVGREVDVVRNDVVVADFNEAVRAYRSCGFARGVDGAHVFSSKPARPLARFRGRRDTDTPIFRACQIHCEACCDFYKVRHP